MHNSQRILGATVLQVILLMTATVALLQQRTPAVEAAGSLTTKGFVTAKAEGSLTILEAGTTFQVAVNKHTQVMGRRTSFQDIAINDLVRIEAGTAADNSVLASRIEVLLAADGLSSGQRARPGPVDWLLSVIMNGGIVVYLP